MDESSLGEVPASTSAKWPSLIPRHTGPPLSQLSPILWWRDFPHSSFPRSQTDILVSGGGSPWNWQDACATKTRYSSQRRGWQVGLLELEFSRRVWSSPSVYSGARCGNHRAERLSHSTRESISEKEGMVVLYMKKKVEAMFIASDVDTVRTLLSERLDLDIAKSWVNETHDRGGAVLVADRPVVRLDAVVSEAQAMPT